jgi:hypothetical protein
MPSPFPGMDPWLEAPGQFGDIHDGLIFLLREALNAALPDGYVARGGKLVWVDDQQRREPDVGLYGPEPNGGGTATAVLPGLLAFGALRTAEEVEQPYLEIRGDGGERLVTAVEVLSPSNKRPGGAGQKAYRDKQTELRLGGVNAVEIDLLRGGEHATAVPLARLRRAGPFDYHVCVTVAGTPDQVFAAPFRLADRLPAFGIPLDPGVAPVVADLQPLLERAYDTGRYARTLDYHRDPDPALTAEQKAWADAVLRERGLLPAAGGPT